MQNMDFHKIKNFFQKRKKPETFHEKIVREKQQKYLFRADEEEIVVKSRGKKPNILEKTLGKKPKNKHSKKPEQFSGFFQYPMKSIIGERDLRHIMGFVGILLFGIIIYILAFSPYFKISPNKVLIEALNQGIDTNIVSRSIEGIYGQSIFAINEAEIAQKIKENQKNAEQIRIDRLLPNGVKILVRSLPINFDASIFGVENKRFGISSNGVLVPLSDIKNEDFSHHLTLVSKDLAAELFLDYKKVVTDKNMLVIAKIFELFDKEWADLKIANANYFVLENELHIVLESNTKIIIALQAEQDTPGTDFSQGLLSQLLALQTYINTNRSKLIEGSMTYLDIRIPGKIFACADANTCKKNLVNVYGAAYE